MTQSGGGVTVDKRSENQENVPATAKSKRNIQDRQFRDNQDLETYILRQEGCVESFLCRAD